MEIGNRTVNIYYGSQTGNTFELAERIFYLFRTHCVPVTINPIKEINLELKNQDSINVICVSTTGQGDPPENAKEFFARLMHKDAADFENFEFCLFAMGDSAYTKFNWIGLQIARRLEHLKGLLLFPVVSCDERHQLGYDFGADKGIAELQELLIKNNIGMFDYAVPYFPRCPVEKIGDGEFHFIESEDPNKSFIGKILKNERVTARDHFQETHLIEFSLPDGNYYDPGDVLNIKPKNPDPCVEMVFEGMISQLNFCPKIRILFENFRIGFEN